MFISPAYAQTAAGPSGASAFMQFLPLIFIFVIFYFLMIRPQQRRMKEHRAMIEAVKKGDNVVTSGGLIGKVVRVQDNEVEVEIAPTVKVRVVKSTLSSVGAQTAANDGAK
ncbi:preprotein translocase subunit YajC [Sphingoaurantiacus capsulatus]|uniref:Sec translocon accessory complex subunit YajC n=1 Tax=Sphingoaurantiacus capsulatus TaxID=1771310 RepID=A0ABV7XDY7_9SPHN